MDKGVLIGIITGMWVYTIMKGTYDECVPKTRKMPP